MGDFRSVFLDLKHKMLYLLINFPLTMKLITMVFKATLFPILFNTLFARKKNFQNNSVDLFVSTKQDLKRVVDRFEFVEFLESRVL